MFHRHPHERRLRAFGFDPSWEGGPGRGHGHHLGRGRGRRGSIRAAVLGLLAERPMHGYEMISELERRTGGFWRPSPGSIYPALQILEERGYITLDQSGEETTEGGKRRYTLTDKGRTSAERSEAPWQDFDQSHVAQAQQFREAGFGLMQAVRQVGAAGTEQQRERAIELLNETKRKLYAILAE